MKLPQPHFDFGAVVKHTSGVIGRVTEITFVSTGAVKYTVTVLGGLEPASQPRTFWEGELTRAEAPKMPKAARWPDESPQEQERRRLL